MHRCAGRGAAGVQELTDAELEQLVHCCNFYITKAKNVRAAANYAVAHEGRVPTSYDGLSALPGVGPKIAHLMRSVAFGELDAGIVVDTHVFRVATKLGWASTAAALSGAEKVRQQLEEWVPHAERVAFSLAVVGFGQHSRSGHEWGRAFVDHVRRQAHMRQAEPEKADSAMPMDEEVKVAESIVARLGGSSGSAPLKEPA